MKQVFKNKYGMNLAVGLFFFLFSLTPMNNAEATHIANWSIDAGSTASGTVTGGNTTIGAPNNVRDNNNTTTFGSSCSITGGSLGATCYAIHTATVTFSQPVYINRLEVDYQYQYTQNAFWDDVSSDIRLELNIGGGWVSAGQTVITNLPSGTIATITYSGSWSDVSGVRVQGTGGMSSVNSTNSISVVTRELRAFGTLQHTFTITKSGTGSGTASGSGSGFGTPSTAVTCGPACSSQSVNFNPPTNYTLTATASSGSVFAGWSGDAGCNGGSLITQTDTNCIANFYIASPVITSITPPSGTQGAAVTATIAGTNLTGATAVAFSGTEVTATINAGGTATSLPITLTITAGAATGARTLTVTAPSGTSAPFSSFTVTAPPLPPTVTTIAASNVTETGATLNGSANPNDLATTGWFRYSTTNPGSCNDTFGTRVPSAGGTALGSGNTAVSYSQPLTGLTAGTTYYYCAIAQNSAGNGYGIILLLATTAPPASTSYKVIKSEGNEFAGWAWGGHVLGWLSFSHLNCDTNGNGFMDINDNGPAGCPPKDGITPIPDYKVWIAGTLPNAPPVASDLQSTFLDRCSANPFEQTMTFNYSDNEGDPMAQYAINVYDFACDANKNQLIDSGVSCVNTAGATVVGNDTDTVLKPAFSVTQTYTSPYNINPAPQEKIGVLYPYTNAGGELTWAKTYYFTVEVRDPDHLN